MDIYGYLCKTRIFCARNGCSASPLPECGSKTLTITEATPSVTPSEGVGQPTGGASYTPSAGVVSSPTTSTSGVIENIASQAEAGSGLGSNALRIVFALAVVILLAIIAAALLMRRRG